MTWSKRVAVMLPVFCCFALPVHAQSFRRPAPTAVTLDVRSPPRTPEIKGEASLRALLAEEMQTLSKGPSLLRVQCIERVSERKDPEATRFLIEAWRSEVQLDPEAVHALAWALARRASDPEAATILAAIVELPQRAALLPQDTGHLADARRIAALALARQDTTETRRALFASLRGANGTGAAIEALGAYPPKTLPPGLTLTPFTLSALIGTRDLRVLPLLHQAVDHADPEIRATGFAGAEALHDTRLIPKARKALADGATQVQRSAAKFLVVMGVPERAAVVEAMLAKPALVAAAVELSAIVDNAKITEALAHQARTNADDAVRTAAVEALSFFPARHGELFALYTEPVVRALALSTWARVTQDEGPQRLQALLQSPDEDVRAAGYNAYTLWSLRTGKRDSAIATSAEACAGQRTSRAQDACVLLLAATQQSQAFMAAADPHLRRMSLLGFDAPIASASALARKEVDPISQGLLMLRGAVYSRPWIRKMAFGRDLGSIAALQMVAESRDEEDRERVRRAFENDGVLYRSAILGAWSRAEHVSALRFLDALRRETDARTRMATLRSLQARLERFPSERSLEGVEAALEQTMLFDPSPALRSQARLRDLPARPKEAIWIASSRAGVGLQGIYVSSAGTFEPVVFQRSGDAIVLHAGMLPGELWMLPGL